MGIIVDLVIMGIIALSTFLAYKKGLVKLAIGLCAFIISIIVTFVLYQPISNLVINSTQIDEAIQDTIYEKANDMIEQNKPEDGIASGVVESAKNNMLPETARSLSINIVKGGVMIVLFVAIKVALFFVTAFADAIAKLPIINQLNKTSGMVYGLLRGVLIVYVILLALSIPGQISPNNPINDGVNKSVLGKAMYEYNVFNVFFK